MAYCYYLLKKIVFFLVCYLTMFTFLDNLVSGRSDKVRLNLYYESLCPYCQRFIVKELPKLFDTDLQTITHLKLVPFGNAKVSPNKTVTCQHGEEECKFNAIEACAIRTWPDPKLHFKFIKCVENNIKNWKPCVEEDPTSEKAINDCYNGPLSQKLILGYGKQTLGLKPKKQFVPWVTINGKPLYDSYDNFAPQVCNAYKGKAALPKICNSFASPNKTEHKLQVSYAD